MTSREINNQVVYYYRNGWKIKAIAAKLDITEGEVRGRLRRIRKKREVKRWWED